MKLTGARHTRAESSHQSKVKVPTRLSQGREPPVDKGRLMATLGMTRSLFAGSDASLSQGWHRGTWWGFLAQVVELILPVT